MQQLQQQQLKQQQHQKRSKATALATANNNINTGLGSTATTKVYSGVHNSSGARTLFFGKFATKYKLITVNTTINFYISAIQHNY